MILGIRDSRQCKNGDDNKLHIPQLHNASRSFCGNYTTRKPQRDHSCPGTGDYGIDHSFPLEKQVPDELIQFAGLAGIIAVGVGFIYLIVRVQKMYEAQRSAFSTGTATAQKIQNLETEFISLLQRVESDSAALQKIAMHIESSVASLNDGVTASLQGASSRYGGAIEELRDHLDLQEERLLKLMEHISEAVDTLPQERNLKVQPVNLANGNGRPAAGNVRLRREIVGSDPVMRFSVLQEWVATNKLAILHRASKGLATPADLIANIPRYFEAEGEITADRTLLIKTRGYPEKLAIPLKDADPARNEVLSRRTDV